eukprot:109108_1
MNFVAFKQTDTFWITLQTIFIVTIIINLCFVAPIATYYFIKIWKSRTNTFFIKRHPTLTILYLASFIFWSAVIRTIRVLPIMYESIDFGKYWFKHTPLLHIGFVLIMIRIWFFYYNYNHGLNSALQVWSNDKSTNHWTESHFIKKYLTDRSYRIYYFALLWVITAETTIICISFFNVRGAELTSAAFMLVDGAIIISSVSKIRPCRDQIFVHIEFKYLGYIGLCTTIIYIGTTVIFADAAVVVVARSIMITTDIILLTYTSTKWVMDRNDDRISKNENENRVGHHVKLQEVLQDDDMFDLFTLHLVKEFSIENLMFVFSAMQFKLECVNNGFVSIEGIGTVLDFGVKTNALKREDAIIDDMKSFCDNLQYIFNRFIDVKAFYCVNISSKLRKRFIALIKQNENGSKAKLKWVGQAMQLTLIGSKSCSEMSDGSDVIDSDLQLTEADKYVSKGIELIDEAMKDIVRLLSLDSLPRFTCTDEFKNAYNMIQNDAN